MSRSRSTIFLAALLLIVACSKTSRKVSYVEKGNRLASEGKYEDAEIFYRKALQIDPKMPDALYRLGMTEFKQGKVLPAYQMLNQAASIDPKNVDIVTHAADLNLNLYLSDLRRPKALYDRVAAYANGLLAQDPHSFEGMRLKGYLALIDRHTPQAIDLFRRAQQVQPNNADIGLALSRALYENGQQQESEAEARKLIAQHKDYGPAYDFLFLTYRSKNRMAEAEQVLVQKAQNNPKNIGYVLELARFYDAVGNQSGRDAVIDRILQHKDDFTTPRLQIGTFYMSAKRPADALAQFQQGLQEDPKHKIVYQKAAANALLALGRTDEARSMVETLVRQNPKDSESQAVHAAFLMRQGKVPEALAAYESAVAANPDSPVLRYNYGVALATKGDVPHAREQFEKARSLSAGYVPPRFALAELSLRAGQSRESLDYINEILRVQPTNQPARLMHASALLKASRYEDSRRELERLIADNPKFWDAQIQLGNLYLARSQTAEAEKVFRAVYQANPGNAAALGSLTNALLVEKEPDAAIRLVSDESKKPGASPDLRLLLAQTLSRAGKFDQALAVYAQLQTQFPKDAQLIARTAEIYQVKGDVPSAVVQFQKATSLAPNDPILARELADALQLSGRDADALTAYRTALKLGPGDPLTMNNLAFAEAENGQKLDNALMLIKNAIATAPNNYVFQDTLGWIYFKQGQADVALPILTKAVSMSPGDAAMHYHLAAVLFAKGDHTRARQELQTAIAEKPLPQDQVRIKELMAKIS